MIKFFSPEGAAGTWRPPIADLVVAPAGRKCIECDVYIVASDYGFILPFLGSPTEEKTAVYHRKCLAAALGVKEQV